MSLFSERRSGRPLRRRTRGVLVGAGVLCVALAPAPGASARPAPEASGTPTAPTSWTVAPGLTYSEWRQAEPQGPTSVRLLTMRLGQPGLTIDHVSGPTLRSRAPLSQLLAADHDVAGVNADFFDIDDTSAPLGVAVDRDRGLLRAPASGWNLGFVLARSGAARIEQVHLVGGVLRGHTRIASLGGLNVPHVRVDSVDAYTSSWGRSAVTGVVDGATRVRVVAIRDGVVRSNRAGARSAASSRIDGTLLVGRGRGATALRTLRVGQHVKVRYRLSDPGVRVAVGGSVQLLRAGRLSTHVNDGLHPRTAVGIDADRHQLHLLVVDGRSESDSGVTLVQLAHILAALGDENAMNLDGGGSSTIVSPDASGITGVRNNPSEGHERPVPEGLGIRYAGG